VKPGPDYISADPAEAVDCDFYWQRFFS